MIRRVVQRLRQAGLFDRLVGQQRIWVQHNGLGDDPDTGVEWAGTYELAREQAGMTVVEPAVRPSGSSRRDGLDRWHWGALGGRGPPGRPRSSGARCGLGWATEVPGAMPPAPPWRFRPVVRKG